MPNSELYTVHFIPSTFYCVLYSVSCVRGIFYCLLYTVGGPLMQCRPLFTFFLLVCTMIILLSDHTNALQCIAKGEAITMTGV